MINPACIEMCSCEYTNINIYDANQLFKVPCVSELSAHDLRLCQPNELRGTTDGGEPCVRAQIALPGTDAKTMTVHWPCPGLTDHQE